jgi:hypothetical protein
MSVNKTVVMTAVACLIATGASAQAASQSPAVPFTMSTYYRCDYNTQARADTLYKQVWVPVLERQIKAGRLSSYAFYSHRMGGVFRRLESLTAPTLALLIAAQDSMNADLDRTNPKGSAAFDAVCGSHDDYIWNRTQGSPQTPATPVPAFLYSRYLVCDMGREGEADLIMGTVLAPIINKHLAAGHIANWGWNVHNFGGTTRRIMNWGGPNALSVLNAEEMLSNDIADNPMGREFTAICNSHTDYVWELVVSGH